MNDPGARSLNAAELVPLALDQDYVRRHPAPGFWALMPHHIHQHTDSSCSLASAVMVLNAARGLEGANAIGGLVSERRLLEMFQGTIWPASVQPDGGGLTLPQLADHLGRAFSWHGLENWRIETRPVEAPSSGQSATLRADLAAMEEAPGTFLIANFHLDRFYGDGTDVGHFSPLSAYDSARDRVLILDVYKADYEPAWAPVERLLHAMARHRDDGETRGYLVVKRG